jgi:hypothetical protein
MARPERNTVDYFPHLLGEGKKMYFIENKYGNNGYAVWYKILEKLGSTEYHYLNLNKEEEVMFLASKCKVSEDVLLLIINDLSKMDVFHKELWSNKIIWCPQFIESIEDAYKKRNNKCITLDGLRILLDGLGVLKLSKCTSKGHGNTQSKGEDSKEEDRREYIEPSFLNSFEKWMKYKAERKQSYKSKVSEQSFYNSLLKLSNNNPIIAEQIVDQSIANNWAGIFELKNNVNAGKNKYYLQSPQHSGDFWLTPEELIEKKASGYWKEAHEL